MGHVLFHEGRQGCCSTDDWHGHLNTALPGWSFDMMLYRVPLFIALAGLCSPALADQGAPAAAQPDTTSPSTSAPSAIPPATRAPGATTPAPATSASQLVDREFAAYDLDKSGDLNAAEFSAWVTKLRKPADDGAAQPDSPTWSASLFARADVDHNQSVSKTEMTTLLAAAAKG
jgi:hypothetical protein